MHCFAFCLFSSFCGLLQFPGVTRSKSFQQLSLFLCHKYPQVRLYAELEKNIQIKWKRRKKGQNRRLCYLIQTRSQFWRLLICDGKYITSKEIYWQQKNFVSFLFFFLKIVIAVKNYCLSVRGWVRFSSYDPSFRAGSATSVNFTICSYRKFHPSYRGEKWFPNKPGLKSSDQAWRGFFAAITCRNIQVNSLYFIVYP